MMKMDFEDDFPCFRCGVCCRKYQVRMTRPEAQTIAGKLGISFEEFLSKFTDPRWPGQDSFLLVHKDGGCVFLNNEPDSRITGCSIHSFRPEDCRAWSAGIDRPECQSGLDYWGLSVEDNAITGTEADVAKFEAFLKLLE